MSDTEYAVGGIIFFHVDGTVGGWFTRHGVKYPIRGEFNPEERTVAAEGEDIALSYTPDGGVATIGDETVAFSVATVKLESGETAHGIRSPLPPRTNAPW